MKLINRRILIAVVMGWPMLVAAQLQFMPDAQTPNVFGGAARKIKIVWRNDGEQMTNAEIRIRIFQASSATAVLLADLPWKNLQVLPQQTVVESAALDFPVVKVETKFFVQWLAETNQILGVTEVLVYPTNLLAELRPLVHNEVIGLFDPQNELKPLLKNSGIGFMDLENSGLENFSGRLAIVGPFLTAAQMRDGLAKQMETLVKNGADIVWLLPKASRAEKLSPSFYSVPEKTNAIVVVQPELVADLPANPQAQRNLVYFCKLALQPQSPALPDLSAQP
jgi:hypothetical protein